MRKFFNFMLIAAIAIGISSCSKDAEELGVNPAGQTVATTDGDIDWSVFQHLGDDVVADLKKLMDNPQTRSTEDLIFEVNPANTDVPAEGVDVVVTIGKRSSSSWPSTVKTRIVEYSAMDKPLSIDLYEEFDNPSGEELTASWTIPAFYSSSVTDSRVLVYQIATNDGNWRNMKIVLQNAMVGNFMTNLARKYPNSRVPQTDGKITIISNMPITEDVIFRIRSLDDPTYMLTDAEIKFTSTSEDEMEIEINANPNNNVVIPFVIEYRFNSMTADKWLELERGIQETGPATVIAGVNLMGAYWIGELTESRTFQLKVDFAVEEEIEVRVLPYRHSAHASSDFESITYMAYKVNSTDPSLSDWKFSAVIPAARGAGYNPGEVEGGWHKNFANELKAGINGAGFWLVQYKSVNGEWIDIDMFKQRAYYLGVKNDVTGIYKEAYEWEVITQGNWPNDAIKFRAYYEDNQGPVYTPEVIVNTQSETLDSWEPAPSLSISENDSGYTRLWKFQYWINEIGEWRTWDPFNKSGYPEYGWEGKGNTLKQHTF